MNDKKAIYYLDWMIKMSLTVKKLHDNDIIHFNLQPRNILIMNEFQPVIGDFTFAKTVKQAETMSDLNGNPRYIGKKAFEGKTHLKDKSADIYALTVIFIDMIKGY